MSNQDQNDTPKAQAENAKKKTYPTSARRRRILAFVRAGLVVVLLILFNWQSKLAIEVARMAHGDGVNSVAFSPDGRNVISGGCDQKGELGPCARGTARIWEAATGKEMARVTHDGEVYSVAFSPDGKNAVSAGCEKIDKYTCVKVTARVWEATTGKEITRITYSSPILLATFLADGKYVMAQSEDGTTLVREANTGKEVIRMNRPSWSVSFSSDGKYIVSSDVNIDNTVHVVELATCNEVIRVRDYFGDFASLVLDFSPKGKYVAWAGWDDTAGEWEVIRCKEIIRVNHDEAVYSVAFSPDRRYVVSGSMDRTARVWEVATGEEVARMTHDYGVDFVTFSPDGKYVLSGDDTVRVWDVATGKEVAHMPHKSYVSLITFSPDGRYVISKICKEEAGIDWTYCTQSQVRVWNASSGQEVARVNHEGVVESLAFSPDGRYIVSGGNDGTVRVWLYRPEDLLKPWWWLLVLILLIILMQSRLTVNSQQARMQ